MGPFDSWPSGGGGFEYFYGFIGGETNQYYPAIYDGTVPIEPEKTPEEGYHFTEDMTDKAIRWIRQQKALMGDKPFFVYFAREQRMRRTTSPRSGRRSTRASSTRAGTTCARRRSPAREARRDPARGRADRPARGVPAWEDMPDALSPALTADGGLRRLPRAHRPSRRTARRRARGSRHPRGHAHLLHQRRQRGERGRHPQGCFNELVILNGALGLETTDFMVSKIDDFGTPAAYNHYAVGWAHAMDTPYQWTKQVASHWGGTRNGTIVHWPSGIQAKGEVRAQFHHAIDVAPTVLDAGRAAPAHDGTRGGTEADRGREHALCVRRCRRGGAA